MLISCKDKNGTDITAWCSPDRTPLNPGGTVAYVYVTDKNGNRIFCREVSIHISQYKEITLEKSIEKVLEKMTFKLEEK